MQNNLFVYFFTQSCTVFSRNSFKFLFQSPFPFLAQIWYYIHRIKLLLSLHKLLKSTEFFSHKRLLAKVYSREKYQKWSFAKVCSREKCQKRSSAKVYSENFAAFLFAKVSSFKVYNMKTHFCRFYVRKGNYQ